MDIDKKKKKKCAAGENFDNLYLDTLLIICKAFQWNIGILIYGNLLF